MKPVVILSLMVMMTSACSKESTKINQTSNPNKVTLSGVALLPRPLASITIMLVNANDPEQILAQTTTSAQGAFLLEFSAPEPQDVLLVRTSGPGSYVDAIGLEQHEFPAASQLAAIFVWEDLSPDQLVVLDPWSTIAFCLADGWHSLGKSNVVEDASWKGAATLANSRVGDHVGAQDAVPEIPFASPFDPSAGTAPWPSANTVSGLASTALALVAQELYNSSGATGLLLQTVCEDLEDGRFDGEETRWLLAEAAHQFLESEQNLSGLEPELMATIGGFYETVSTDSKPPYSPGGALFDPYPPQLWFEDCPENGELVCQPITITLRATDNRKISTLTLFSPSLNTVEMGEEATVLDGALLEVTLEPEKLPVTGPIYFLGSTTDDAGNQTLVELDLIVDGAPPVVVLVTPDLEQCTSKPPQNVEVIVSDEDGAEAQSVTFLAGLDESSCQLVQPTVWSCQPTITSEIEYQIIATDRCQRTAVQSGTMCIDDEAPVIELSKPDGAFYNQGTAQVSVSATDDTALVALAVYLNDQVVCQDAAPEPCLVNLPLPDPIREAPIPAHVYAVAVDSAGNEATASATYQADTAPPQLDTSSIGTPVFPSLEDILLTFGAQDEQSGLAEVVVESPQGPFVVESQENGLYLAYPNGASLTSSNSMQVTVRAVDLAGNFTEESLTIWVDDADPLLWQEPNSFIDESAAQVSLDVGSLEPIYDLAGGDMIILSQATCQQQCPPFSKLASRLGWEDPADEADNNLPVFQFGVSDICPPPDLGVPAGLTIRTAFYFQDKLLQEEQWAVEGCGPEDLSVPFALPFFSSKEADPTFDPEAIPDRLEVSATDLSGRSTVRSLLLEVTLASPPLFVLEPQAGDAADDALSSFLPPASLGLHHMVQQGAVLGRSLLVNPYPIQMQVEITHAPRENVMFQARTSYVEIPNPPSTCGNTGTCAYKAGNEAWSQCTAPKIYSEEDILVADGLPTAIRMVNQSGLNNQVGHQGDTLTIGPLDTMYLDVMTDYATVGLSLPDPEELEVQNGLYSAYNLSTVETQAICTLDAVPFPVDAAYKLPFLLVLYASGQGVQNTLELKTTAGTGATWQTLALSHSWADLYLAPFPVFSSPPPK